LHSQFDAVGIEFLTTRYGGISRLPLPGRLGIGWLDRLLFACLERVE